MPISFFRRAWSCALAVACTATGAAHAQSVGERKPFPVNGVVFEYNAGVRMTDGLALRANIFRPDAPGKYPVIITHGIYGKDVAWQTAEPYKVAWSLMSAKLPNLCKGSTCQFMRWEMPDPERWVPAGYVVIHADSRGSGKTPGYLDPLGARETQDFKELIEWAAVQPWSNGKVGLSGISYYAINQWQVAALQPRGLAAIIPWEGAVDHYRDISHHGGIPSTMFARLWFDSQILPNQHGNGASPFKDALTGAAAVGPALPPQLLAGSREAIIQSGPAHPLNDESYRQRTPDLQRIVVPTLSVGNWAGAGLHLRGNIEGYAGVGSQKKWLRVHSGDHFSPFYAEESFRLQRRFFDQFLKGVAGAFDKEPPVELAIRHPVKGFQRRAEESWPLKATRFERFYLDASSKQLSAERPPAETQAAYEAASAGQTFRLPASSEDREFTGPVKAKLWVRTSTTDADFFVTLRLLDPQGKDVTFQGANAPAVPVTNGWLRLSHRQPDARRSTQWRPFYVHVEPQPVEPEADYAIDVEIWPTSVVVPAGYTLALTIQGEDFAFPHLTEGMFRGSFPFLHGGRDPKVFGGRQTILTGGKYDSHLLLPLIPPLSLSLPRQVP